MSVLRSCVHGVKWWDFASRSFTRWSSAPSRLPCFATATASTCVTGDTQGLRRPSRCQSAVTEKTKEEGRRCAPVGRDKAEAASSWSCEGSSAAEGGRSARFGTGGKEG